jgi:hypothetical protein
MDLTPAEIPQRLIRQLIELDADYAEALWGLDQPPGKLSLTAMLRDTLAALGQLPDACSRLRSNLPSTSHPTLSRLEASIRTNLNPAEALQYSPRARSPKLLSTLRVPRETSPLRDGG